MNIIRVISNGLALFAFLCSFGMVLNTEIYILFFSGLNKKLYILYNIFCIIIYYIFRSTKYFYILKALNTVFLFCLFTKLSFENYEFWPLYMLILANGLNLYDPVNDESDSQRNNKKID